MVFSFKENILEENRNSMFSTGHKVAVFSLLFLNVFPLTLLKEIISYLTGTGLSTVDSLLPITSLFHLCVSLSLA